MKVNPKEINAQRSCWEGALKSFRSQNKNNKELYGYSWGDPNTNNRLGNYKKIKDEYLLKDIEDKVVLELGCLGGKWTQYLIKAKKLYCVDINETSFEFIRERLPHDNIDFYLSNGYNFRGISDNSIDLIFCIDTLVRTNKSVIHSYLIECKRILKEKGRICFHLPCTSQPMSRERGFLNLSEGEIKSYCNDAGIEDITINKTDINHGILLMKGY